MISILILTKNEERDLPGCLASVAWSDDVHVFDSSSTDRTCEIALAAGVHLHQRRFDNYSAQRNAALQAVCFKHPWIFILDCDERMTGGLHTEMEAAIACAPEEVAAFRVRRNDYFLGSWLKHAQIMPFYTRLVRAGRVRYKRAVNEVLEVDGRVGQLSAPFDHYPFSKGLTRWLDKHNLYSTLEARIVAERSFLPDASWKIALWGEDFHQRRHAQKAVFYRFPCRWLIRWAYIMFYRGGVLDGRPGWTYAALQAIYEYLICLKARELAAESTASAAAREMGAARASMAGLKAAAAGASELSGEDDTLAKSGQPARA